MKASMNILSTSCLFALAVVAISPRAEAQREPPPQRVASEANSEPDKPVVLIRMNVLEVQPDRGEKLEGQVRKTFPNAKITKGMYELGKVDSKKLSNLLREIADQKNAEIISRPQVMTQSGETATIAIGQEIDMAVASDPGVTTKRQIGLTVECRPKVSENGETVLLELDVQRSTLGVDNAGDPRIDQSSVSTQLLAENGQTIALVGPRERGLLIFMTPIVQTLEEAHGDAHASAKQPSRVRAKPAATMSGLMSDLQRIKIALNTAAPGALQKFTFDSGELQIEALLDSPDKIKSVTKALTELDSIALKTIHVSASEPTRVEAIGSIRKSADAKPPAIYSSPLAAEEKKSANFVKLEATIRELFPDEKVLLRELNHSLLLRGNVSPRSQQTIVRIAEDYFPTVINDLTATKTQPHGRPAAWMPQPGTVAPAPVASKAQHPRVVHPAPPMPPQPRVIHPAPPMPPQPRVVLPSPPKAPQPRVVVPRMPRPSVVLPSPGLRAPKTAVVRAKDLNEEVRELREEVKSLRTDVRKLIELIEAGDGHSKKAQPKATTSHVRLESATRKATGTDAAEPWHLTLSEAVAIAVQNKPDAFDLEELRGAFERLNVAKLEYEAAQKQGQSLASVARLYKGVGGTVAIQGIGDRKAREKARHALLDMTKNEVDLRSLLGLSPQDGRRITPTSP